jgi:DHA2 family multidrug resistance protein
MHQTRLAETGSPFSPIYRGAVERMGDIGLSPVQAADAIMRQIETQAYLLSSTELFWLSGWMTLAMVGVVWLTRKPAPSDHVAAAD